MTGNNTMTEAQKSRLVERLMQAVAQLVATLRSTTAVAPRPSELALARDLARWRSEGFN